jgi:aminoglycoside phosphotransferase family enzyme/predicted kinase
MQREFSCRKWKLIRLHDRAWRRQNMGSEMEDLLGNQERLVRALAAQLGSQKPLVSLVETHLSWVIVLPDFAYKIKKALHLPFVDYSTLAARHFFCNEELRLNGRLAPELYLGVVAVTGSPPLPRVGGKGRALEYAVQMRSFDATALWAHRLQNQLLQSEEVRQLSQLLARFHHDAARAHSDAPWGSAAVVLERTEADLAEVASLAASEGKSAIRQLTGWHLRERNRLAAVFAERKAAGWIRECHGDLHAGNILTINGSVQVFDGIEFNDSMRWIDTAHDFAFAWMDLQHGGRNDLAARLLSCYLQSSGDYEALRVLPYYRVQRALVRAKVAFLRAVTANGGAAARAEALSYIMFAARCTLPSHGVLLITQGFSGSGKSLLCERLLEPLAAIHISSDIERKRPLGLQAGRSGTPAADMYTLASRSSTYRRLAWTSLQALAAGLPVLVDATFLQREQRVRFRRLARRLDAPFGILAISASPPVLEARIATRAASGTDPSDADQAVLDLQRQTFEPLQPDETAGLVNIDNTANALPETEVLLALILRTLPELEAAITTKTDESSQRQP